MPNAVREIAEAMRTSSHALARNARQPCSEEGFVVLMRGHYQWDWKCVEVSMAGKKFLNPVGRIILCAIGMLVMGYFLLPAIQSGDYSDRITIVRGLVFLAFGFLLVRSIAQVWYGSGSER